MGHEDIACFSCKRVNGPQDAHTAPRTVLLQRVRLHMSVIGRGVQLCHHGAACGEERWLTAEFQSADGQLHHAFWGDGHLLEQSSVLDVSLHHLTFPYLAFDVDCDGWILHPGKACTIECWA